MRNSAIILFLFLLSGCNSWLELRPEDERVSDQYWKTEEDVRTTTLSCYVRLRECLPNMLVWGELRSDNLAVSGQTGAADMQLINTQDITSENTMVEWDKFYRVINSANSVIAFAPLVLDRDPLFTEESMKNYVAEAKAIRALSYYYLVRSFRDVPLVLEPFVSDDHGFLMAKTPENVIWAQIVKDLQEAVGLPETYKDEPEWHNKGRMTQYAVATILAEVSLWTGDYAYARRLCELVINSGKYNLISDYYDNFSPGYSDESILELFYDDANNQGNKLYAWFNNTPASPTHFYQMAGPAMDAFEEGDFRGEGATFYNAKSTVWKYLGSSVTTDATDLRPVGNRAANWIFYRYADVLLTHAEACAMQAAPDYASALSSLNEVRLRAGLQPVTETSFTQEGFMELLLRERRSEFVGEGKRWFDLLRLARIKNFTLYKDFVVNILLKNVSLDQRPIYQTKLAKVGSFYFPIFKDEIDMSMGVLVQNEAYQ